MLPINSYSVPSIDIPSIENLFSVLVMNVIDETCNNVQEILIENIVDIRDDEDENPLKKKQKKRHLIFGMISKKLHSPMVY